MKTNLQGARRLILVGTVSAVLGLMGCAQPGALSSQSPPQQQHAQAVVDATPASPASVERLLKALDMERTLDASFDQIGQIARGMGEQAGVGSRNRDDFERYMQRVSEVVREEAGWAKMKEPLVQIYAKHYSEAEVQGLIAFYESPLGRSMTAKTPAIMQDSALITQDLMKRLMPRIAGLAKEMRMPAAR